MSVILINPINSKTLHIVDSALVDDYGNSFPIVNGVPRITLAENYADNFGMQWNKFDKTQLDRESIGYNIYPNFLPSYTSSYLYDYAMS
jgi:hypothetical protein